MTENEFMVQYEQDKPMLKKWAEFIITEISKKLPKGFEEKSVKIPVSFRLKDDKSILEKAFIRKKDKYKDPYKDVQDKVGIRWVVLLTEQLDTFCKIIESNENWYFSRDKTLQDWEENPNIFEYQSVHYILTAKKIINHEDTDIQINTPCEVQLRTLLQHTYSEFGHDTIYKGKFNKPPEVLRYLAKSMALLETTDELLCTAKKRIDEVNQQAPSYQLIEISNNEFKSHFDMTEKDILGGEKTMYFILSKMQSVFDSYEGALKDDFTKFLNEHHDIFENIKENKKFYFEFNHPIILLVYFLVYKYRRKKDWHPFSYNIMENIYTYFGYSYEQD